MPPQKVQVHDDWSPDLESYDADIAVITFEAGAIIILSYVQPICLWNEKTDPTQTEGQIEGWGQSENLNKLFEEIPTKLKVPIHTNEFCFLTTKDLVDLASNRTFCAGRGDRTGVCTGDSGGGVTIKVGSTFYFRGIVSSGLFDQTTCDVSKFSIFTDVLKFKPWIDQIMSQDGETLILKVVPANLICTIQSRSWNYLVEEKTKYLQTCFIKYQKIDDEGFSVADDANQSIQGFHIEYNNEVKFLPENMVKSFPELIAYQVYNCSIKTVNGKHFKGLDKLEVLALRRNEIESIDEDSFKDFTKLVLLGLGSNKIKTIDPKWFQSFETLQTFDISYNQIETLDENIFDNLQIIENISLKNNKLSTIPANLFQNNLKLEYIWLHENKIGTISSTMFDHLKNLNYVGLENNSCVNSFFHQEQFIEMKNVLSTNCASPV